MPVTAGLKSLKPVDCDLSPDICGINCGGGTAVVMFFVMQRHQLA